MWRMLFTHYLFGFVGTALCSVGLVLALCSVYIFTRRQMRSAVATYLAALSISDSCLLSLGLMIAINSSIPPSQQSEFFYSSYLHKQLFPFVYPCIIWFQFTSVWITTAFAVDRWFAIKWPMLHYTYSSKRACYIVLTIYGLGFIYSIPRFFEYKTEVQYEKLTIMDNQTEDIPHLVITNKVLDNHMYHYIVQLTLYSIFQSILPFVMLSYFNVELIRSINASSNFLKRFTSLYTQNRQIGREANVPRYREGTITRSVICLIGLFTLCQVPASILHYIYMFYQNHPVLYICYDISNFLILVNSAVNFFIFTYFNRKFRRELARVCFHTKKKRDIIRNTSSHQSFRRSNSCFRTPQQNSPQFDIPSTNSWEQQQRRNSRNLLQNDNEASNERINLSGKKSSDLSIQSQNHLHPFYHRSESLINLRISNMATLNNKNDQIKRNGRHSICDFSSKHTKSFPYLFEPQNLQNVSKHSRRFSERLSFNHKKHPLTIYTNSFNHRGKHLHYVTYKRKKLGENSLVNSTSTATRSSILTTGSESSIQNKLIIPTDKHTHSFKK